MPQQISSSLRPVIAFMTDFGLSDGYVGVMKGVVLSIAPDVHIVDITHDIAPQHVTSGAWILATSYRYFPKGTIYTCVVDPGVGSMRRPIAVHAGDWFFVGPDNGLFSYVFMEQAVHEAVSLSNPAYRLPQVSATFHGRDVFSPAAAHIARGVPLAELGPPVDPTTLYRIDRGLPTRQGNRVDAQVAHIDHFGNLVTTIPLRIVPDLFSCAGVQLTFPAQAVVVTERREFFSADSAEPERALRPFIYGDSSGYVSVAIRNGNAARTLGIGYGANCTLVLASNTTL